MNLKALTLAGALLAPLTPFAQASEHCMNIVEFDTHMQEQGQLFAFGGLAERGEQRRSILFYVNMQKRTWTFAEAFITGDSVGMTCILEQGSNIEFAEEMR